MQPSTRYQALVENKTIHADARQQACLLQLDRIYHRFCRVQSPTLIDKITTPFKSKQPIKGFYLWGEVGIGKTFLIDLLYDCLPGTKKRRQHFFNFMRDVHLALKARQGLADPLRDYAKTLASETQILCFDEFFVNDISDAMLLSELLQALFAEGVCLVTTSNIAPSALYAGGLQRQRFLPAIAAIKRHCHLHHLDSNEDYRLQHLSDNGSYHSPLNEKTAQLMQQTFQVLSNQAAAAGTIEIMQRQITVQGSANQVAWFNFATLCQGNRSQRDYLEISERYATVLLSNVPVLDDRQTDSVLRFIQLVDVLYDAQINVIISAAVPLNQLYQDKRYAFEFQRTQSRLQEMQSLTYFQG